MEEEIEEKELDILKTKVKDRYAVRSNVGAFDIYSRKLYLHLSFKFTIFKMQLQREK